MAVIGTESRFQGMAVEVGGITHSGEAVVNLAATALTLTAEEHGGRIIKLSHTGAESTVTLPAATGTGNRYLFIVAAVNTSNHKIQVANATDVYEGVIITTSTTDSPDRAQPWPTASGSDTVTLNGTTKGGQAIGDWLEFIDYASGKFMLRGVTTTSGTEVHPFSADVS